MRANNTGFYYISDMFKVSMRKVYFLLKKKENWDFHHLKRHEQREARSEMFIIFNVEYGILRIITLDIF